MITSKEIAEKIHLFYNLLYHLDDYIKNKKERKEQLNTSKNIRLVLREVISSKNNVKYFISKEEIDSQIGQLLAIKNIIKEKKIQKDYKNLRPFSFNQKNLKTINLFYSANNEAFVLNYLILEKVFSIIRFCFYETLKKRNNEFIKNSEDNNFENFSLRKVNGTEMNFLNEGNLFFNRLKNNSLKNNIENKSEEIFDTSSSNQGLKTIKSNKTFDKKKINDELKKNLVSINISSLINDNYNINNITSSQDIQLNEFIRNNSNLLRNLRWQVKIMDDKIKLNHIKEKFAKRYKPNKKEKSEQTEKLDKLEKPEKAEKSNEIKKENKVENHDISEKKEKLDNFFIKKIKKKTSFPLIINRQNLILNKSEENRKKFGTNDATLISEHKIEAKNIFENLIKFKKINYPRTNPYIDNFKVQSRSGIFRFYDYKNILPLFKISKLCPGNEI